MPKRIKVTQENNSGLNTKFHDNFTGENMTLNKFIKEIKSGNYENYHIRKNNETGTTYVASNPDKTKNNNLDN